MSVPAESIPQESQIQDRDLDGATINEVPIGGDEEAIKDEKAVYDDFPDGGLRAWTVVAGVRAPSTHSFGYVNSWGVFQSYYEENVLPDTSASAIAWIGSIQYALVFIPGLVTGRLFDLGYLKAPLFLATCVFVVATFLVAECTKYWHFLLCQGIVTGFACGIIFGPMMGIIGHWFRRKRGLALGMNAIGSSMGGTIFPIAARNLIKRVGFPWTMRILGFIILVALSVPNLVLQRRLPPKKVAGGFVNPKAFKYLPFTIYCLSGIVAFLGLYTVLTYIDVSATKAGVSEDFSFYLVSIANASSSLGRLGAGILTDKYGAINVMAPLTLICAVMTYAWPFARSQGSLIAIAVLYGVPSGAYVSNFLIPLYEMGEVEDIGRRTGMAMTFAACGALAGPPISGAIYGQTGGYEAVGYYAGSMIVAAVSMMLLVRFMVLKKFWGKF
ncbi:major facilitator superfamily domain-containing protein [Schizophyllum commune]